jgi:cell division protein FtsL
VVDRNAQRGVSLLTAIIVALVLLVGIAYWMRSAKEKERAAAHVSQSEHQLATARQSALDTEKKAFDDAQSQLRARSEFDKAVAGVAAEYSKWKDAAILADSTARVSLAGPVAALQAIKRDTEAAVVPPCLEEPKKNLVGGMEKVVNGFVLFMQDANIGKALAHAYNLEANELFTAYEAGIRACKTGPLLRPKENPMVNRIADRGVSPIVMLLAIFVAAVTVAVWTPHANAQAVSNSSTSSQPYRCTVGGKTTYQQDPCAGGKKVDVSNTSLLSDQPVESSQDQANRQIAWAKRQTQVDIAVAERRIFVGMTQAEVIKSWGSPHKINQTLTARGSSQQWVYKVRGAGNDQYVYVDNGVVRAIQSPE